MAIHKQQSDENRLLRIIVLPRGWVFVGYIHFPRGENAVVLTKGACIRRWGTQWGLGQLQEFGPQPQTILDPIPRPMIFPGENLLFALECNPAVWPSSVFDIPGGSPNVPSDQQGLS